MKKYIYPICIGSAVLIQIFLRTLLQNGVLSAIPGDLIIYPIAYLIARAWSKSYDDNQE